MCRMKWQKIIFSVVIVLNNPQTHQGFDCLGFSFWDKGLLSYSDSHLLGRLVTYDFCLPLWISLLFLSIGNSSFPVGRNWLTPSHQAPLVRIVIRLPSFIIVQYVLRTFFILPTIAFNCDFRSHRASLCSH
jgi:hypothetical protein